MKRPARIYGYTLDGTALPYVSYMEIEAEKLLFRQVLKWRGIKPHDMKRCDKCGFEAKSRIQFVIHHRHYRTLGHEHPQDVCLLCKPCHDDLHARAAAWKLIPEDLPFVDPNWEKIIRERSK